MTGNKGTYRCSRYAERSSNQAQVGCGYREGTAGKREQAPQNTVPGPECQKPTEQESVWKRSGRGMCKGTEKKGDHVVWPGIWVVRGV